MSDCRQNIEEAFDFFVKQFSDPYCLLKDQYNSGKDPYLPELLAFLVLVSYFSKSFKYLARLDLSSARAGSGKTWTADLFVQLAKNGHRYDHPSYATLTKDLRDCDSEATVWLDEFQHFVDPNDDYMFLIRNGYDSGTTRKHFDHETKQQVETNLHVPLHWSYIKSDIRSLPIALLGRSISVTLRKVKDRDPEDPDLSDLPRIKKLLTEIPSDYFKNHSRPKVEGLFGRDRDKWSAIHILGDYMGGLKAERAREMAKVWVKADKGEEREDRAVLVLRACHTASIELGKEKISVAKLIWYVKKYFEFVDEPEMEANEIKSVLRDFSIKTERKAFRCPHSGMKPGKGYLWSSFANAFRDQIPEVFNSDYVPEFILEEVEESFSERVEMSDEFIEEIDQCDNGMRKVGDALSVVEAKMRAREARARLNANRLG